MMSIFIYPYILQEDTLSFDYYFITSYLDKASIEYLYNTYNYFIKEKFKTFEEFYMLITECNDQDIVIVIDVKYKKILCYDLSFDE
jgi:hypothetical protein